MQKIFTAGYSCVVIFENVFSVVVVVVVVVAVVVTAAVCLNLWGGGLKIL